MPGTFSDILTGEAVEIQEGLLHTIALGVDSLVMEFDFQTVINLLDTGSSSPPACMEFILKEILELASQCRCLCVISLPFPKSSIMLLPGESTVIPM